MPIKKGKNKGKLSNIELYNQKVEASKTAVKTKDKTKTAPAKASPAKTPEKKEVKK